MQIIFIFIKYQTFHVTFNLNLILTNLFFIIKLETNLLIIARD